jgi:uncharacterized protein
MQTNIIWPVPGRDLLAISLVISVLGLLAGPLLASLGRGRPGVTAALDGLALGVVPAVLGLRLLPHVYQTLGALAFGLFALGYLAVWLSDRHQHRVASRAGGSLVFYALLVHALTDGASLAAAAGAAQRTGSFGLSLFAALLVHRLPEGLFLATSLLPQVGKRGVWVRLGLLALATCVGALAGDALLRLLPDVLFDGVVALGLGAMLRLVMHSHAPPPRSTAGAVAAALGMIGGLAVAFAIPTPVSLGSARLAWLIFAGLLGLAAPGIRVVAWMRHREHEHGHEHEH